MAYFDENGNEVKGLLTEAEVQEKLQTETKAAMEEAANAKAQAQAAADKTKTDMDALQAQIDAAKAAPAGGDGQQSQGDKDQNLSALRQKLEETQSQFQTEREQMMNRLNAIEGDKVEQAIAAVAAGNPDLAEKIRHNYNKTLSGVQAVTAEEISLKVQNAVKLSVNAANAAPNPMDLVQPGAASPMGKPASAQSKVEFNEAEKQVGQQMGISDADREKYGNDPRLTNMNTR